MQRIHYIFFLLIFNLNACADAGTRKTQTLEPLPTEPVALKDVPAGQEVATFAGGCFWCTEAQFERVKGVQNVVSGYAGGPEKNPTYDEVSYGKTGHTESIQIFYDPQVISYKELLEMFFYGHDPTTLNRQGPDVGAQYRSAVFYHNAVQKQQVLDYVKELEAKKVYRNKIVTEIKPFTGFWIAEKYHQDYYEQSENHSNPYITNVTAPKVNKFMQHFKDKLKPQFQK
jgi:peptide-methionine (S)-S-oxide reductase